MSFLKKEKDKRETTIPFDGKRTELKNNPFNKVRGGGILSRFKELSRRDLALILCGVGVLVAAPLAEFAMSVPQRDLKSAMPGLALYGKAASAGVASLPYEVGINSLSSGSADGSGELITPLSSRDPSSLILSPVQAKSGETDYSDKTSESPSYSAREGYERGESMGEVARNAFAGASGPLKSAPAPLKLLSFVSAPRSLPADSIKASSNMRIDDRSIYASADSFKGKVAERTFVKPVGSSGYGGVSSKSKNTDSSGLLSKLKAQAAKSANNFNVRSAVAGVDSSVFGSEDAAAVGGFGEGGGSAGSSRGGSGSGITNKSGSSGFRCSTLQCEADKQRQNQALEWEKFLKYDIKKTLVSSVVQSVADEAGTRAGELANDLAVVLTGKEVYYCLYSTDKAKDEAGKDQTLCTVNTMTKIKITKSDDLNYLTLGKGAGLCNCGILSKESCDEKYSGYCSNKKIKTSTATWTNENGQKDVIVFK